MFAISRLWLGFFHEAGVGCHHEVVTFRRQDVTFSMARPAWKVSNFSVPFRIYQGQGFAKENWEERENIVQKSPGAQVSQNAPLKWNKGSGRPKKCFSNRAFLSRSAQAHLEYSSDDLRKEI